MMHALIRVSSVALILIAWVGAFAHGEEPARTIDDSLSRAAGFLVSRQSVDGAWRSDVYGTFHEGLTLTPHVLSALHFLRGAAPDVNPACDRAADYLFSTVDEHGQIRPAYRVVPYPVYTSAEIAWALTLDRDDARRRQAQSAWIAYLRDRQFDHERGWSPEDPHFGGWGYSPMIPHKASAGQAFAPAFEANLSATVFAIGALRSAKISSGHRVWRDAARFVERCQNVSDDPATNDPAFDDGGFFFAPDDPVGNKAGLAGVDRHGRNRYASYGSMTADGVRALLQCGHGPGSPRVVAARRWLESHFRADTNPGRFPADREVLRDATYYYYCWSLAHAMARLRLGTLQTPGGEVDWARELSEELIRRQNGDGSWTNRFTDARENDPLVATPFAAAALVICRQTMNERR